jgi:propionyl-CoA synthetase
VVAANRVKTLFAAPTALRAIKRADPEGRLIAEHDTSSLQTLFLAGERTDPDTYNWAAGVLGVPVVDHWWQTETGWPITGACLGLGSGPGKPGSAGRPVPGYDVRILGEAHEELSRGAEGSIAIRLPLAPGALLTLWSDDQGYRDAYLSANPGYYTTGDGGRIDEDGEVHVMGRMDDVINVAGHRLSTGAIEGAIAEHPGLAECAVIGVPDEIKGQLPLALVVPKDGVEIDPAALLGELQDLIRSEIGAIAALKEAEVVGRLPKTRSGKVLRATMRAIAEGRPYKTPATIEDPAALTELEELLRPAAYSP